MNRWIFSERTILRVSLLLVVEMVLALTFSRLGNEPSRAAAVTLNTPASGTYPNTNVALGGNTTITPDSASTDTIGINVSTDTNFKGTFVADPATGVIRITNAHPAGNYEVTVVAIGVGGFASQTFSLTVGSGVACIATPGLSGITNVAVGSGPNSLAVGDFNNDGNQDFAAANVNSTTVSIRLGDGAGNFSGTTDVGVGGRPYSVAVGNFNNDGNQDIATANYNANTVSIRLGDGAGNFSGTTDVGVEDFPFSVAVGDFNNDSQQDFAAVNRASNTVSIRLGDGAGNFSGTTDISVGSNPYAVAVGDFNNDGNQDIATANNNANTVSIRLGNGAGDFSGTTDVGVGSNPLALAVGNFDNNNQQDFAAVNRASNTVSIRLGDGLGGFSGMTDISVGSNPYSVAVGDFNNDGQQDLAVATTNTNTVSIRLGDGAGNFSGTADVGVGKAPDSVAVGDFNNDGKQDIAAANNWTNNVSIRLGNLPLCYDGNGNTDGSAPVTASYAPGTSVTVEGADALVKTGSTFSGWNTTAGGIGTEFAPAATFNINAPTILYAQWTLNAYTVSYEGNGNTGGTAPSSQTKTYGVNLTLATNSGGLTKTGYTFNGWNTLANGTGIHYAAGATYTANAAITLYAGWTINTYAVSYNGNGSTGGTAPSGQTKTYGVDLTLRTNSGGLARTGYTFNGWNTLANGSGTHYAVNATYSANAVVMLYAQWTANTYTVTFDGNGGGTPFPTTKQVTYGSAYGTLASVSRDGYTFDGWFDAAIGGTRITETTIVSTASNHTLYAHWTTNTYQLYLPLVLRN